MEPIIQQILEHMATLNDEMGGVQRAQVNIAVDVAVLKTQVASLMWWFKGVMGCLILFFVTQFWQIVIMKKNGKR